MNILPLVFAFLLIFSFLTLGFIQEFGHSILTEKSIRSFHTTSRAATNTVARKLYARVKSAPVPNTPVPATQSTSILSKKIKHSQRASFPPLDISKFNIQPLLELKTDPKNDPLYEIAVELLRILYGETLFKQTKKERIEYDLLNAMLKIYRTQSALKELSDLFPDASDLKPIFYKMLKGTNQYDVPSHRGIPPLEDFFHLKKAPSIHFTFASVPLLEALFGQKMALKILAEEKTKYENGKKGLTQEDLTALIANDPIHSSIVLELGQQIDFSQKQSKRTSLSKKDMASGLVVKKKLS